MNNRADDLPSQAALDLRWRLLAGLLPSATTAICVIWLRNGWAAVLTYHLVILASLAISGSHKTLSNHTKKFRTGGARDGMNSFAVRASATRPSGTQHPLGELAMEYEGRTSGYLGPFRGRWNSWAIVCCLMASLAGPALYLILPAMLQSGLDQRLTGLGFGAVSLLGFMPYFALVNPILEEVFWRGLLRGDDRSAVAIDLLFAAYHLFVLPQFLTPPFLLLAAIVLFASARTLRAIVRNSGGLWPAICTHMLADIGIILAVALQR